MEIENIANRVISDKNNEYIRKVKEYISLILYAVEKFERQGIRPVIVMSRDIAYLLSSFTENTIRYLPTNEITCCGYDVKTALGSNILLVAYDLQPMWKGE